MLFELKYIELIEKPILDFSTQKTFFLFKTLDFTTLSSLKRKIGNGLSVPNGSIFLISSKKLFLNIN